MTVSRVVNREPNVLASTRDRVDAAIATLGYVPNTAARSLAGRGQARIVLLYANPSAAYLSEFLVGSLGGAEETGAQLIVERWHEDEAPTDVAARLSDRRVDAVLLPPPLCEDRALLSSLAARRLPFALVAAGEVPDGTDAVTISDEAAAHAMTAHLVAHGHRRIGFIAGDPRLSASRLREAGHLRALREAGIDRETELIRAGAFTYRSGMIAAEALLALDPRPTAIFASNDDMAAGAIAVAHRLHLAVPEDMSVVGFDDTAIATSLWPELTTIRQPIGEMARAGVIILAEGVRARRAGADVAPRRERLDFLLVERGSASDRPIA